MSEESQLLSRERKKCTFSIDELTHIIDGGKINTESRHIVENVVRNDPELIQPQTNFMTRDERFTEAMRRTVYVYKKLIQKQGWSPTSQKMEHLQRAIGDHCLTIHSAAFIPSLISFCSEAQLSKWLPLAVNLNIIGTYAQTELGHGTFLRGLETVATYDRENEEFVVNCPKISSMKWWPGDMGKNANHALVMANLKIDNSSYGMHPFIVQIRDLTTHQPLPGVSVGDIGDKMAFQTTDNGFLYLQNVRIPRENLLCKNAEVSVDGSYKKKASDRLMYGSMVSMRVRLQKQMSILSLAKVNTIAVRYSAVRRQGLIDPKKSEVAVLDYLTQQYKLFPNIATVYCTLFAVEELKKKHQKFLANMSNGDISELPALHALSAGMKAFVTDQCNEAAEILRRSCGGHGYSNLSGLPTITTEMLAASTYEGENTVMYLQCARYLMKLVNKSKPSVVDESAAYLWSPDLVCPAQSPADFKSLDLLAECFQQRAKLVVKEASKALERNLKAGEEQHHAWNNTSVYLLKAAKVHVQQSIICKSIDKVKNQVCSPPLKLILEQLCALYALHQLNNETGDFFQFCILDRNQYEASRAAEVDLLKEIRPNAVSLVDAFEFSDENLQSCIGAYDGNAYERLYEAAKKAPFNKTQVHEASFKYLKPFLLQGKEILESSNKSKL